MEHPGRYRHGGFHPIHIGDHLSKYIVVDKLGSGGATTVWLAKEDGDEENCVAIAVYKAEVSDDNEARVTTRWWKLRDGPPSHPGKTNILLPIEYFHLDGPNGKHFCLVLTLEGQTLSAATERGERTSHPLPFPTAKRVALELIRGLEYAHSLGLAHSDLHPQNILLGLPLHIASSVEAIQKLAGPPKTVDFPDQEDSKHDNVSRPRYLVQGIFSRGLDPAFCSGPAKIADWNESFFPEHPPSQAATIGPYVAPEFNSPNKITTAIDIWCLGCLIFEVFTGRDLFGVKDDPTEKVLNSIMEVLGTPPEHLFSDWVSHVGKVEKLKIVNEPRQLHGLLRKSVVEAYGSEAIRGEEVDELCDLICSTLVYEPADRPSINSLVRHPAMRLLKLD